jgi:hypothetical protein
MPAVAKDVTNDFHSKKHLPQSPAGDSSLSEGAGISLTEEVFLTVRASEQYEEPLLRFCILYPERFKFCYSFLQYALLFLCFI